MPHAGIYAAVSAEIRSGNCSEDVLDRLHSALENEEVSADEAEYLQEVLAESGCTPVKHFYPY